MKTTMTMIVAALLLTTGLVGCIGIGESDSGVQSEVMRSESEDFGLVIGYFTEQMLVLEDLNTSQAAYAEGYATKEEHDANLTEAREHIDAIESEIKAHEFTNERVGNLLRQSTDDTRNAIDIIEECGSTSDCVTTQAAQDVFDTFTKVIEALQDTIQS